VAIIKTLEVFKMIKFEVNNGRTLEITQNIDNDIVNIEHWNSTGQKESNTQISAGDFVMLLNYLTYTNT